MLYFHNHFYKRYILKNIIHQDLLNVIMHFISVVIILYSTKLENVLVQVLQEAAAKTSTCEDFTWENACVREIE